MIKTWQQRQAETGIGSIEAKDDEIRDLRRAIEQAEKVEQKTKLIDDHEFWISVCEGFDRAKNKGVPAEVTERLNKALIHPPTAAPAQPETVQDGDLLCAYMNGFYDGKKAAPTQPLTDADIEACMKKAYATAQGRQLEHAFARAIEAHIKGETK
jgi:hypothetical protein